MRATRASHLPWQSGPGVVWGERERGEGGRRRKGEGRRGGRRGGRREGGGRREENACLVKGQVGRGEH
jgi:hypothetical protein